MLFNLRKDLAINTRTKISKIWGLGSTAWHKIEIFSVGELACNCLVNTILFRYFIFFSLKSIYKFKQQTLIIIYTQNKELCSLFTPKTNTRQLSTTYTKYLFTYTSFIRIKTRHLASPNSKQLMIKQINKIATYWRTQKWLVFYNSKKYYKPQTFNQQY
jgi:hypothetical protein